MYDKAVSLNDTMMVNTSDKNDYIWGDGRFNIQREINFLYHLATNIIGVEEVSCVGDEDNSIFSIPVGKISTDETGNITKINSEIKMLLGDVIGDNLTKYLKCAFSDCEEKKNFVCLCNSTNNFKKCIKNNKNTDGREKFFLLKTKDGDYRKMAIYNIRLEKGFKFIFYTV